MASNQACAPSTMHSVDRRNQAAALRTRGYPYHKIGSLMGISKQAAYKLVQSALEARRQELDESIDHIRLIESERYDDLTKRMFKRLDDPRNPDPEKTVQAILRIGETRAKLLGLNAPSDYRILPGGPAPVTDDVDLTALSLDELRELEQLKDRYDAIRASAVRVQLPAGEPVSVVPAPPPDGPNDDQP